MRVDFIGLDKMGLPVTQNLLTSEYERSAPLVKTPRQASSGSDVVIIMMSDVKALETVAFGKDGILNQRVKPIWYVLRGLLRTLSSEEEKATYEVNAQKYLTSTIQKG